VRRLPGSSLLFADLTFPGASYPALAGNMGAVCTGGIVTVVLTLIKPDNTFNWESTRALNNIDHFIPQGATKPVSEQDAAALDEKDEKESGEGDGADEKRLQSRKVEVVLVQESAYDLTKGGEPVSLTPDVF
jgi:hypothetical protein